MRVDTGSAPQTGSGPNDLDARAQLKRYFGAIKRGWYVIAVLGLVGAGLGWLSAPAKASIIDSGPTYYRATHTLLRDTPTASGSNPNTNVVALAPTAYLVGTGDIPTKVANELGVEVDDVEGQLVGIPREQVGSIEIQALGTDSETTVRIAEMAARLLLDQLEVNATTSFETRRDETVQKLARLDDEINGLTLQIAIAGEGERSQLEAQRQSLSNQYTLTYEQFTQLANAPAPTAGLVSLQDARADEISENEFDRAVKEIADGLSYVTGAPNVTTPQSGGGGSGTPGSGASATTRAILGAIVGIGLAIGVLLALDRFDNRLRHRDEVETATGLTVLAEIPPLTRHQQSSLEVVAHTHHRSRAAEAYRVVRSALLFAAANDQDEQPRPEGEALVVMVTSANPEEGKTTTVANLASVLAEGGFSVLVVNCDFRRPRVHKYLLGLPGDDPKTNRAATSDNPNSVVITGTMVDKVKLVTGVGENDPDANPLDVVALQRRIIQTARTRYDVIVLDTAPFLTTNDASELLSEVDQVVLVVRAGKTRRLAAARTAEILDRFEAPVTGIVLNDSDESPAAQYYYSYYLDSGNKKKRTEGYVSASREERSARTQKNDGLPSTPVNGDGNTFDPSTVARASGRD